MTIKNLISTGQNDVFAQNQNTYGNVAWAVSPLAAGNAALVLIQSEDALTEEGLNTLLGEGNTAQIIAQDDVPELEGYASSIEGRVHVKYAPAAASESASGSGSGS